MKIFAFVFLVFLSGLVSAQQSSLNFINLTSQDGLSSDNINAILKDRYGYIWFATDDGLSKFDGNVFTNYRHDANNPKTIGANAVEALYEDKSGNLWVGVQGGPISFYDRKMDCFQRFYPNESPVIRTISGDSRGRIWFGGFAGLKIVDKEKKRKINYEFPKVNNSNVMVTVIYEDSRRQIWIGTSVGLFKYLPASNKFIRFAYKQNNSNSLTDDRIKTICEDGMGNLWIGTLNGLSMLNKDMRTFKNYHYSSTDASSISSNTIYTIKKESDGHLWLGTEQGINILDPRTGRVQRVEKDGRNKYSLSSRVVKSIFIDKEGIYWIGTYLGGINKYDKNLPFFNLRQSNPFDQFSLKSPIITSFAEEKSDKVFVGTDGGGVSLFDRKTGLFHHLTLPVTGEAKDLSVLTLEKIEDKLWIGCFSQGLYVYDIKSGRTLHFLKDNGLSSNDVFCLKKDSSGNIWIGTNGGGIDIYNPNTGSFKNFQSRAVDPNYRIPLNNFIRAIEFEKDGHVWLGSTSGLALYEPKRNFWKVFDEKNSNLSSNKISSILVAKNGEVWVGTFDGLNHLDRKKGTFVTYSERDGLSNSIIYKILEDDAGSLWLSTNKGISRFDPVKKRFKNYSYHNGVSKRPFFSQSGLKLSNGDLFFGGVDGLNYFNPQKLFFNKNVPNVVLTDLKISNQSVIPSNNSEIKEHISVAEEVTIDYKQNFSISFATLSFTVPNESRYFYRLKGFDADWNDAGSSKTAVYTNLDPGKYVFEVKAQSEAGEWFTQPKSIRVYVKPPFWLTIYAYIFYIILTGGILLFMRWRGTRKLQQKFAQETERIKVEQMINEERKEAERVHAFDQQRIKFLTNLSHEFRTPIALIMGPIEKLLQRIEDEQALDELGMVKRNARRLLNLVNQLLDFRRLEENEIKLNLIEGDFISFMDEVSESFRDLSERKKINFEFRSSIAHYQTCFDFDKMERIVFNLLSNAFKFTLEKGSIILAVDKPNDGRHGINVSFTDTGIGIEEEAIDKIFDTFFQSNSSAAVMNQGTGIGLSITRELVNLHGGTITVESTLGRGTTFVIYFPFELLDNNNTDVIDHEEFLMDKASVDSAITGSNSIMGESDLPVVLLIEDNEDFRHYLKENLKEDYRIVEASDGRDGWQKVLGSHPEIVVSDISMPFMSGVELCQKIKKDKRTEHIPVILLTALTGEDQQLRGLETGANDYMTKPFNFDILNVKIKNLLLLNDKLKNTYSKRISVASSEFKPESGNERLLNKIIKYIESNLAKPNLSVEDLSKHLGMSRGSLYTKILELTGETPVEYIRTVKLGKAIALMEKTDMNIAQVAYASGFSSSNYFARAFRAKYNMSPREFINQNKK